MFLVRFFMFTLKVLLALITISVVLALLQVALLVLGGPETMYA